MATDVTRFWTFLMRTENSVTRVYYNGYDKNDNYINSYVDLSQVITNSGFTDTYKLEHFILPAINSVISDISLTLPISDYMISSDTESRTYYVGSLSNNNSLGQCKFLAVTLKQTVEHLDTGNVDYTQVLTDINTNLSNLNTNIINKNNQSDIVSCLQDIFMYTASDTNNKISAMKCENVSSHTENYLKSVNCLYQLRKLVNCFSNLDRDFNQPVDNNSKSINILSDKLSTTVSINNANRSQSVADVLSRLAFVFTSSTDFAANNLINSSFLKHISDKLANSNDLHTISQAIDLISTAIAQSDQSSELGAIKDSIDNLHLEQNNLIQVEGVLDYRLKPTDAE